MQFLYSYSLLQIRYVLAEGQSVSLNIKDDEKYLTYPYEKSHLAKESAVIKENSSGEIVKIYAYDNKEKLQ